MQLQENDSPVSARKAGDGIIVGLRQLIKEIRRREPGEPAKVLRKHVVKISIYILLQEEKPKSIREIARKIGMTERQTWKHIKELRQWGLLPSDFHSKKQSASRN
jgi:biotin operon repressor